MLWAHFGWIIFSGSFFLCKTSFRVEKILQADKKNVVGTFWTNHLFWQFFMVKFYFAWKNFAGRQKKCCGHILGESFFLAVFHGKILFCVKKFCRQTKKMLWAHFGWIIFSGSFFYVKFHFVWKKFCWQAKKCCGHILGESFFLAVFFYAKLHFVWKKFCKQTKKMLWAHFGRIIFSDSFSW